MSSERTILDSIAQNAMLFWRAVIVDPSMRFQEWRCKRAKAYLLRHDSNYRNQYAGLEIARRRSKLYARGVSPMDASIPDRWTMEEEMPSMAWPHKSTRL